MLDVRLSVANESAKARTVRLRNAETVVGRQRGCSVRIPAAEVSRRHCLLRVEGDVLVVEDLGSANGTFVNGQRVGARQVVCPGDRLTVGPVTFVVEYGLTQHALDDLLARPAEEEDAELAVEAEAGPEGGPGCDVLDSEEETPFPAGGGAAGAAPVAEGWHLPEGDDLRDLLARMEDEAKGREGKAAKKRKPKPTD